MEFLCGQFDYKTSLIDAPPVLLYSFIEQTLQPGPAVSLKCSATGKLLKFEKTFSHRKYST